MAGEEKCGVVVAGMGPVGAALALALAAEGVKVIVVEPSVDPFDKPRAIGIDHDALRLLQKFGVMDDVAAGLGEYRPSEYRSAAGEVLRRILPHPQPHPQAWPPYSTFVQPELEHVLRRACAASPLIDMRLGWKVTGLSETEDEVRADIAAAGSEEPPRTVTGRYLVGCDGARSLVREAMDARIQDMEFDEQWLVVDVIVDQPADLPDVTVQYCNARRPATYIAGPGSLHRWEIMLLPGEDGAGMAREDKVWELLSPWLRPDQGRLWRAASYRFHALVVENWQRGRMMLAGDAAHQTPPFMAQGLNQGFRDVANLAWKLGAVIRGEASPEILDSYTAERRPNAAEVIDLTKQLGKIICECDPARAAERDRKMLEEMASGRGEFVRQDMLPPLLPGRLVMGEGRFGSGAGKTFPQPFVRHEGQIVRLDDITGSGFLLFLAPQTYMPPGIGPVLDGHRIDVIAIGGSGAGGARAIEERDGLAAAWLEGHRACAALVRPDRVVFGTARDSRDIEPLIRALLDALGRPEGAVLAEEGRSGA